MARRLVLTKTEIKHLAEELDTSRGYLRTLVQAKPWLTDISRQHLCEAGLLGMGGMGQGLCDKFPVFRTVALMNLSIPEGEAVSPHITAQVEAARTLRPEAIVSTTLNPDVALSIAAEQADKVYWTGGMFSGGIITTKPVIIRYEIPLDRVVLFIPAIIAYIKSIYSKDELLKTRYRGRYGTSHTVLHIFKELAGRAENEVIADVTGLDPDVQETDGDREVIFLTREILRDPNFDAIAYMKRQRNWGLPPAPPSGPAWGPREKSEWSGPTEEQVQRVQWINEWALHMRKFFDTPWRPAEARKD